MLAALLRKRAAKLAETQAAADARTTQSDEQPRKRSRVSDPRHRQATPAHASDEDKEEAAPPRASVARLGDRLQGARFRLLNEFLYTHSGAEAMEHFSANPDEMEAYHVGFRAQAGKWPQHPLDVFITLLRRTPSAVVGDFGCGEARLAASVSNKVHSFDLVALNERIVACDMAHVPLPDAVLDVAVFCLSLMGTNYLDYLREARRVLRKGAPQVRPGRLWVAEVTSRFEGAGVEAFEAAVCAVGFRKAWRRALGPMFVLFEFLVAPQETSSAGKDGSAPPLKPCRYKKR